MYSTSNLSCKNLKQLNNLSQDGCLIYAVMLYIYVAVREASFENSALYYYSTTTLSNNKFEIVDSDMSLLTDY